jgi:hypothetical protein
MPSWGSGCQTDKHLPQSPFTSPFLADILNCRVFLRMYLFMQMWIGIVYKILSCLFADLEGSASRRHWEQMQNLQLSGMCFHVNFK